jgi:perosamine synthetase
MKKKNFKNFIRRNPIDIKEQKAAQKVIENGVLSDFLAASKNRFNGGYNVLKFEKKIKNFFRVKHAFTFNSWTSGLVACVAAIDLEAGDEVITSTFTMSATVFAIIQWQGIPVFADIDKKTFCLDPKDVEKKITSKTKAILLVDINGHPSDIEPFLKLSKKYKIKIIVDAAQSIGAKYLNKNKFAGTIGDIGGFSLNVHKHINTGEGGIVVTNNSKYAKKISLIRNHGENIVQNSPSYQHFYGYNYRMGEIEAAIGIEQLKKFPKIIKKIQDLASLMTKGLSTLNGLTLPEVSTNLSHSFYAYPIVIDLKKIKCDRKKLISYLNKEGVPIGAGYQNIHRLPFFQKKIKKGISKHYWSKINVGQNYKKGICPVAEKLHDKTYLGFPLCHYEFTKKDIINITKSFHKVWKKVSKI